MDKQYSRATPFEVECEEVLASFTNNEGDRIASRFRIEVMQDAPFSEH